MTTTPPAAPAPRLTDDELLRQTQRYERAKRIEGSVKRLAGECQRLIVGELGARGVREWDGPETHVTVVSTTRTTVDGDRLYELLGRGERAAAYRTEHDLNALPEEIRARILNELAPAARRAITRRVLDPAALEAAVVSGRVAEDKVAVCSATTSSEPYVRISHGPRR